MNHFALLLVAGFYGGLVVGYIGLGIESVIFFTLTVGFGADPHKSTVTAVAAIGGCTFSSLNRVVLTC